MPSFARIRFATTRSSMSVALPATGGFPAWPAIGWIAIRDAAATMPASQRGVRMRPPLSRLLQPGQFEDGTGRLLREEEQVAVDREFILVSGAANRKGA